MHNIVLHFPITEPAQVVGYQVVFLTARALHQDHSLLIGLFGELLGGALPTHRAGVLQVECASQCPVDVARSGWERGVVEVAVLVRTEH